MSNQKTKKMFNDLEKVLLEHIKAEDTKALDETIIGVYNTIQEAAAMAKKASLVLPATIKARIF